jgi:hypothetical protein
MNERVAETRKEQLVSEWMSSYNKNIDIYQNNMRKVLKLLMDENAPTNRFVQENNNDRNDGDDVQENNNDHNDDVQENDDDDFENTNEGNDAYYQEIRQQILQNLENTRRPITSSARTTIYDDFEFPLSFEFINRTPTTATAAATEGINRTTTAAAATATTTEGIGRTTATPATSTTRNRNIWSEILSFYLVSPIRTERPEQTQNVLTNEEITTATENLIYNNTVVQNTVCPISLENFTIGETVTKIKYCGHTFKSMPLLLWLRTNNRCPVCRHDMRILRREEETSS